MEMEKRLEKWKLEERIETIQTTAYDRPEYREESWRLEETYCHSGSGKRPQLTLVWKNKYYYYYYSLEFSHQRQLMVFHWRLSDSKSPQVSRTLLSILAVFNNAVVWMVSTRPPTSKSSRPFNNPLVTVPKAPITIGIIVTFIFHRFFFSILLQGRGTYLFFHIL